MKWLIKSNKPIIITENGMATEDDNLRINFLQAHLDVVRRAVTEKFPIRGYFHWSFLDNYEWLEGNTTRFGLVEVDYNDNYRRKLKNSAQFFANYIKSML